ncbi:MAG: LacI family DNA-binding transcriptional regulator [Dichotomicrobium sp.]
MAQAAGVSPATVSRFYNSPSVVRPITRERIERAATELGYIRNRAAGALQNRRSGAVGLIVPTIDNAIFAEVIQAFATRLRDSDRTLLIAAHGYDLDVEVELLRSLLEHRVDGVALVGFDHRPDVFKMLQGQGTAFLSLWNYRTDADMPCIGTENLKAGQMVTRHLIELGHRDIALFFPDTTINDRARDRMNAVRAEAAGAGVEIPDQRVIPCSYNISEAKTKVVSLFDAPNPPTALICGNDIIAHGAIYGAQAMKLNLPRDLSIVGIGDFNGSAEIEPGLTTVRLPARRIGRGAADMIAAIIDGRSPEPNRVLLPSELVLRGSTCPPVRQDLSVPG